VREAAPELVPGPNSVQAGTSETWLTPQEASPATCEAPDPDDELFLLGEACADAYMQADALHYRAMELLAEFHRREGWKGTGFSSTADWLAWRIGIRPGAARERLRTALALEHLPLTSEAMKNGELSFTKVRSLTRVARPENEATLLAFARAGSAVNLERVVRGWKTLDRKSELTAEQIRHRSRRFSAWVADDGMVEVRGRLDPEVGALLMRAVEAAADALFRDGGAEGGAGGERCPCGGKGRTEEEERAGVEGTTPEQRRADAVGLLAERALAAGFGRGCGESDEKVNQGWVRYRGNVGNLGTNLGGGDVESSGGWDDVSGTALAVPLSGTRAERYQVMLHVDVGTLKEEEGAGAVEAGGNLSELEDGTRVSAETSRRIACDSGVVTIARGFDGQVRGAGRRTRTVPPALRRALEARDRGCRFPGCGLRFTDAHHVKHWADGGETKLSNLVLLCKRHHRAVHEGGVQVCIDRDGQVVFFSPRGQALRGAPPAPRRRAWEERGKGGSRESLGPKLDLRRSDPFPGAAHFTRDHHIPGALEAAVWEALDSG